MFWRYFFSLLAVLLFGLLSAVALTALEADRRPPSAAAPVAETQ